MEKSYGAWSRINDRLRSVTKVLPDCLWWNFSVKMIGGAAPGIWYIHSGSQFKIPFENYVSDSGLELEPPSLKY